MDNPQRRAPERHVLEDTPRLLALRAELERWEATTRGDPLVAHHSGAPGRYLVGLRAAAGALENRSDGALLAAFALGPRSGALPGAGDLGPLLEAAGGTRADVVDLAIASGCGWRRTATADHEWHGRWVAAMLSLSWLVGCSINRTMRWFEGRVSGVREALRGLGAEDRAERFTSHAQHLAMELSLGACRCGHRDPGAAPHTLCGRPGHRLASWRPEDYTLQAFIATAVHGSPRLPPRAGAFAMSMLANLLRDDRRVRVDGQRVPLSRPPRRVFLSHTSERAASRSERAFVAAARSAVIRAGDALIDMAFFTAQGTDPAEYCARMVTIADVYVGIIGLRYGSPVRGPQDLSFTELEFETATAHGLPRLIFLLAGDPTGIGRPPRSGAHARQAAFRRRLQRSGLTTAHVASPAALEMCLYQALVELCVEGDPSWSRSSAHRAPARGIGVRPRRQMR